MNVQMVNLATHPEPHLSVAELAEYWGVCQKTIYRDIQKGALKVMRVGSGGNIRIPIDAAREYGRPQD